MDPNELNEQQLNVVQSTWPIIRLNACAGAGKTKVLVHKFVHLVEQGFKPETILAITFTEKAAQQLEQEIGKYCDLPYGNAWIMTFHSFALSLMRKFGHLKGFSPGVRIALEVEKYSMLRDSILKSVAQDSMAPFSLSQQISIFGTLMDRYNQEYIDQSKYHEWLLQNVENPYYQFYLQLPPLIDTYVELCRKKGAVDFETAMKIATDLVVSDRRVRNDLKSKFNYVLVDEYQDCNKVQEILVKELAELTGHLMIVGDEDQAIYTFRGSGRNTMQRSLTLLSGVKTFQLEVNYRCARSIIDAAACVIQKAKNREHKELRSGSTERGMVVVVNAPDKFTEMQFIAQKIYELKNSGRPLSDIALLFRTNNILEEYVKALQRCRIPYRLVGMRGFFSMPEVRDVLAMLRLTVDPDDWTALTRVLNLRWLEVGEEQVARFLQLREASYPKTALEAALDSEITQVKPIIEAIKHCIKISLAEDCSVVFWELMEKTRYLGVINYKSDVERKQISANIGKLYDIIDEFVHSVEDGSTRAFLQYVEFAQLAGVREEVADIEDAPEAVWAMTVHQAKGLEFPVVIMPSLVDGRFPQKDKATSAVDLPYELTDDQEPESLLEEERRLFYVACTRACEELYLTWAKKQTESRTWQRSRFVDDVVESGAARELTLSFLDLQEIIDARVKDEEKIKDIRKPLATSNLSRTITYSRLSTYEVCPKQYMFKYVYGLPEKASEEEQLGTVTHAALEYIARLILSGNSIDDISTEDVISSVLARVGTPRILKSNWMAPRVAKAINWCKEAGIFEGNILEVEKDVACEVNGAQVRARVDRIDELPNGHVIIDYKTGKRPKRSQSHRDQIQIYAMCLVNLGYNPVEGRIIYVDAGEVDTVEVESIPDPKLLMKINEVWNGVRNGEFGAKPNEFVCRTCPYKIICDEALA